jgi:hydrogenase maturation protease
MRIEQVKEIANAVLYEGYLLYPYRQSAIKNRQRWTIGVVYPREYSEANGSIDPWFMQTECLLTGPRSCDIVFDLHIRFLHLLLRTVIPSTTVTSSQALLGCESNLAGRMIYEPGEEGIEREIHIAKIFLHDLVTHPRVVEMNFPAQHLVEDAMVREQRSICGAIRLSVTLIDDAVFKLCVQIENTTPETGLFVDRHNEILHQSFVSTHTILQVQQGEFISLLEPPDALQAVAQGCLNLRTWPVLVGEAGETDVLLSSPIILYDYPQIAPESPGSLFDGTEIDEILTLRILTLTDDEKEQMRQGDARVREILERTESLTPEQFMKLHGTIRSLKPLDDQLLEEKEYE